MDEAPNCFILTIMVFKPYYCPKYATPHINSNLFQPSQAIILNPTIIPKWFPNFILSSLDSVFLLMYFFPRNKVIEGLTLVGGYLEGGMLVYESGMGSREQGAQIFLS